MEALTKQQREVLTLRYGLNGRKRLVLQEIADEYSLTRERIRQIEVSALERLRRDDCIQLLAETIEHLEKTLYACGGIADEDSICLSCSLATRVEKKYIHLLLHISDTFHLSAKTDSMEPYWFTDAERNRAVGAVMDEMHDMFEKNSGLVVSEEELRDMFDDVAKKHDGSLDCMNTIKFSKKIKKNIRDQWGSKKNPEISLSRLAGYIHIVLREAGEPLHFNEIARRVIEIKGAPCNPGSCHNELVRSDDFTLVGRGLYTLKQAGYQSGSIYDVIIAAMKERGPMRKEEILRHISGQRQVKPESVILTLYKKKFKKNDDGTYYFIT